MIAVGLPGTNAAQTACSFDTAAHMRNESVTIGLLPGWDITPGAKTPDDYLTAAYTIQARFRPPAQVRLPLSSRTVERNAVADVTELIGYGLDNNIEFFLSDSGRIAKDAIVLSGRSNDVVESVVQAIWRADSAGEFAPPGPEVRRDRGAIQLRLVDADHSMTPAVELFRVRIPVLVLESDPAVASMPALVYPMALQSRGIMGRVLLAFLIDAAGRPDTMSIQVLRSPDPRFTSAALRSVKRARFKPGRVKGCSVDMLVQLPIDFKIRQ